jgi:hypothetical protein
MEGLLPAALMRSAESWLEETSALASTWLSDDLEEQEAHVHMRHARNVELAREAGEPLPAAPLRSDTGAQWAAGAGGGARGGGRDADGNWRARPPPGSPAARAECVACGGAAPKRRCSRAQRRASPPRAAARTLRTPAAAPRAAAPASPPRRLAPRGMRRGNVV